MATFVLVHGGYHGGWCFEPLVAALAAHGHGALAPDLPIDDADAGYEEYAAAVLDAMAAVDDAAEIVLVGHSLGCYVVPMVAARRPVHHVVLLCAVPATTNEPLPMDASSILTDDLLGVTYFVDAEGRTMQTPASFENLFYRDLPPEVVGRALRRLRPQGPRPLVDAWPLASWPDVARTVVLAADDNVVRLDAARPAARALTGEEPVVVAGGHSVFLTDPVGLAAILIERATR
jgi:pimeloyl-ACP methyl ester carboxylesterase